MNSTGLNCKSLPTCRFFFPQHRKYSTSSGWLNPRVWTLTREEPASRTVDYKWHVDFQLLRGSVPLTSALSAKGQLGHPGQHSSAPAPDSSLFPQLQSRHSTALKHLSLLSQPHSRQLSDTENSLLFHSAPQPTAFTWIFSYFCWGILGINSKKYNHPDKE